MDRTLVLLAMLLAVLRDEHIDEQAPTGAQAVTLWCPICGRTSCKGEHGDTWTDADLQAVAAEAERLAGFFEPRPAGPAILALARKHSVITPAELPSVLESIQEVRSGPPSPVCSCPGCAAGETRLVVHGHPGAFRWQHEAAVPEVVVSGEHEVVLSSEDAAKLDAVMERGRGPTPAMLELLSTGTEHPCCRGVGGHEAWCGDVDLLTLEPAEPNPDLTAWSQRQYEERAEREAQPLLATAAVTAQDASPGRNGRAEPAPAPWPEDEECARCGVVGPVSEACRGCRSRDAGLRDIPPKPCCHRHPDGERWCFAPDGHTGYHVFPPARELPRNCFEKGRRR